MIVAVVGPTCVGKTRMSIELAKKYNAIVINCDAMQVYKGLDIGTAKVSEDEKYGVPHYLFDIKDVVEEYSVYDYQKDARRLILENKDKNIIFVGGTGLYLKAVLYDYKFTEENNTKKDFSCYTNDELYSMVRKIDPDTLIHPNNRVRLERFLNKDNHDNIKSQLLFPHIVVGLTTDRDELYQKIDDRVDKMVKVGLLDEARRYYDLNIKSKPLLTGIGYKELYDYFDNKCSYEDAILNIKKNSRHYAKRQYTFFRNQFEVKWFDVDYDNFDNTVNDVISYIEEESVK